MRLLNDNIVEECEMVSNYNDLSWAVRVDMENGNMEAVERDRLRKKKKRDRALKKSKKAGQAVAPRKAEVHIPIDLDIARNQILTKSIKNKIERRNSDMKLCGEGLYEEARKALELGKSLGMQIIGNEEEVVEEMVRLELLRE
ncbi:hypothetical protein V6N11_056752 [Hibiscus sabdariffa]|uniref:Uncharacterized protein n=1 Tax=Hibiscus sabdariffa TaxID=183260 RepID=A0ABR2T4R8_9ROSI